MLCTCSSADSRNDLSRDDGQERLTPSELFCEALRESGLDPRVADNLHQPMRDTRVGDLRAVAEGLRDADTM